MIQIYKATNTEFERNGDMTLTPTSATISAELNGTWGATLEHPLDPEGRWKYIEEGAVVKIPSFLEDDQLFRIKSREKTDDGVTAELEPIFYDSIDDCFLVDVRPTNKNGQEALDIMTAPNSKYSGVSNIQKISTAYYQYKNLMEAINGEDENSFINRWGGEILFDNFEVKIYDRVGADYGVELRYGKNIPQNGMSEEVDIRDVVTRIYPKAYNGYTMTGNGYVDSPLIGNYPVVKSATITFDDVKMEEDAQEDDAENGVTICHNQTELDAALQARCESQFDAGIDKPAVTIAADMVLLAGTDEYQEYAVLESVSLGDTVHCHNNHLDITTDARVIQLQYDAIRKKLSSVMLGDFRYDYFQDVSSSVGRIDGAIRPDGTVVAEKIAGFLNGALASLRAQYNVAQKQDVMAILFENLDPESPLYGSLALGTQGLMISKNRTSDGWDWTTAITANGMVADVISAGILQGIKIIADEGNIAGWEITERALYKDITVGNVIYRVYIQSPQSNTDWVFSIQQSTNGGQSFTGMFYARADGYVYAGDMYIAGGTINITTNSEEYSAIKINYGNYSVIVRGGVLSVADSGAGWEAMVAIVNNGTHNGVSFRSEKNGEIMGEVTTMDTYGRFTLQAGTSKVSMYTSDDSSYVSVENADSSVRLDSGGGNPTISMDNGSEIQTMGFEQFKNASLS